MKIEAADEVVSNDHTVTGHQHIDVKFHERLARFERRMGGEGFGF